MTKSLSKVLAALVLSSGVLTAQAANLGTLDSAGATPFFDSFAKNQKDILSNDFKFTVAEGYVATIMFDTVGSRLSFESATLQTHVKGGGWLDTATDSDSTDGFFGTLGAGKYSMQFMFDSFGGAKAARSFTGTISLSAAPVVVTSVPEPESYAMFLAGLGIIGAIARRRTKR